MINYEGRTFASISNSGTGEVNPGTRFTYHQQDSIVLATYEGGQIRFGTFIAVAAPDSCFDMRYSHANTAGELATGTCHSTPTCCPMDAAPRRLRLHEEWQWTSGDLSTGLSVIDEL